MIISYEIYETSLGSFHRLTHLSCIVFPYTVILFCLFYSPIQAASQFKIDLYFPNFGEFILNLMILLGFILKFKRQRLYPKNSNKITDIH